jgi:hypothetical protein
VNSKSAVQMSGAFLSYSIRSRLARLCRPHKVLLGSLEAPLSKDDVVKLEV